MCSIICIIVKSDIRMNISTKNKTYPKIIEKEVLKALSFYPELENVPIEFKFKTKIKKSTMQAQPRFSKLFSKREKREYIIFIKEKFTLGDIKEPIENLPEDVMIGWLGHELGHVMDYEMMSNKELIKFGIKYLLSKKAIIEAERTADRFAVQHGMRNYIIKTKDFILNHADIPEKYKSRITKFYLSTEEIMEIAEK